MIVKAEEKYYKDILKLLNENELPVSDILFERQSYWVYLDADKVIAVCGVEPFHPFAILRSFVVDASMRKNGIGRKLHEFILHRCNKLGIASLFLLTTTASDYFENLGWKSIARYSVPNSVKKSEEFRTICPESADCKILILDEKADNAFQTYNAGFNCAQSVLKSFSDNGGLQEQLALKMTSGLAAGLGFKGSVCGAVMGAYLSIGLKYGRSVVDDDMAKETTYYKMREFDKKFKESHCSVYCQDLLSGDVSDEEQLDEIIQKGYFENACPVFVHTAAVILKSLI